MIVMRFKSHWREQAAEIISEVLDQCGDISTPENEKAARLRLREAYPFGERKYYPYKVWLDEIARQMGKKWPIGHKRAWENNRARFKSERQRLAEWERIYGKRNENS
jgi:hypothetical protein